MYLNETCKNAINIDEFVDNIKLTNRIFEPERLSNDLYQSFKNIV
jgi:hypothetical protein